MISKTHTKIIFLFSIISFLLLNGITYNVNAQRHFSSRYIKHPMKISIGIGASLMNYEGDIGSPKGSRLNKPSYTPGYKITVDQRFGNKTRFTDLLGLQANFLWGKLKETDFKRYDHRTLNFQSKIWSADLNLIFHLERILNFNRRSRMSPTISLGVGYMHFDPYADYLDANGKAYTFDLQGFAVNRDKKYETSLSETQSFSKTAITFPVGIGVQYNITYHWVVKFDYHLVTTMSDWVDGKNSDIPANTAKDFYKTKTLSILYTFGKPTMKYGHKRVKSRF